MQHAAFLVFLAAATGAGLNGSISYPHCLASEKQKGSSVSRAVLPASDCSTASWSRG